MSGKVTATIDHSSLDMDLGHSFFSLSPPLCLVESWKEKKIAILKNCPLLLFLIKYKSYDAVHTGELLLFHLKLLTLMGKATKISHFQRPGFIHMLI